MDSHATISMNVNHQMLVAIMLLVQMYQVLLNVLVMMAIKVMASYVVILMNAQFKLITVMQTQNAVMFKVLLNVLVDPDS